MTTTASANTAEQLAALYRPIAEDLARAEAILARELRSKVAFVEELTTRVQLYRGKRLRPALLLLTAQACGGIRPDHHTLAAVVEMIHAATLVHDDVLDDADRRRHVTTVNAEWGNEASVLLGDFLFTHSFHLAASLESTLACRMIGKATNRVCEGELCQIAHRGDFSLSETEYLEIIAGKTAELLSCSCWLGAHFAGAPSNIVEGMARFGRDLGIAFQIADDLLDLLGAESQVGKSVGADLLKQKITLPLIRFRETADPDQVEECRRLFEAPDDVRQRDQILACLRGSDAFEYARSRSIEFAESAASQLVGLRPSPATDLLRDITQFVVERAS